MMNKQDEYVFEPIEPCKCCEGEPPVEVEVATGSKVKYPEVKVKLTGKDGNAFAIMSRVVNALKKAGIPKEEQMAYTIEACLGDYDQLLRTTMRWVSVK